MCRQLVGVTVVVAAMLATGARRATAGRVSPLRSRAAATGNLPDNPLLAAVPADTPYVFASFRPVPLEALRGLVDLLGPPARRGFSEYMVAGGAASERAGRDMLAEIASLDVRGFEALGFTLAARPLPPLLAGLRGGLLVVNDLKLGPRGPESLTGFGALQVDHTADILQLAPKLDLKADRKPHPLPAEARIPGHMAASETMLAAASGPGAQHWSAS